MKICFFTDIHGNGYAFDSFLQSISGQNIEHIIFGGDVFGYYYDTNQILNRLRQQNIVCLLGNHDKMFLDLLDGLTNESSLIARYGNSYKNIVSQISQENIVFLRHLPIQYEMITEQQKVLGFFHGGPSNPTEMRIYPDTPLTSTDAFRRYDYVFCGHTHHKMIRKIAACTLINPGSAGQPRDGRGTSYCVFDTKTNSCQIKTFPYNKKALLEDIRIKETSSRMQNKLSEVLMREERL